MLGITPKQRSFALLVMSVFGLTYLWFRRGIFNVWDSIGMDPSHLVQGARPEAGASLESEDKAQFALIAAGTHTAVLICGMVLFIVIHMLVNEGSRLLKLRSTAASWTLHGVSTIASTIAFYFGMFHFFQGTFDNKDGFAYRWARGFFYEEGELPFASCASMSYCLCLLCGYTIKLATRDSRFSAFPKCYRRWVWHVLAAFLAAYVFFRYIAIPVWHNVVHHYLPYDPREREVNHKFITVATATHTIALVVGMAAGTVTYRSWNILRSCMPPSSLPQSARFLLAFTLFVLWGLFLVSFVYSGTQLATSWLHSHIHIVPPTFLSVSLLTWFVWGFLLLTGQLPSLLFAIITVYLLPLKMTRGDPASRVRHVWQALTIYIIYNLQIFVAMSLVVTFAAAAYFPHFITAGWIIIIARYAQTYRNHPALTGWRARLDFRNHWVFDEMASYFQHSIHTQGKLSIDPSHRYIFGFHPHGILPISAGFITSTTAWRSMFAGMMPAPLSSSILHHVPLLRDFLQLAGGGDVSRGGIAAALKRTGSVVMLPGGQQELLTSSSQSKEIVVSSKHRGFVRLALKLAAASSKPIHLVPMFNFGENMILDNVQAPMAWQRFSVKKLRANVFFLPYGVCGLPGVPRRERLTTAVAQPIEVPRIATPTEEHVDLLHRRYFTALREVFDETRACAGHGDKTLGFDVPVTPLSQAQWESERARLTLQPLCEDDHIDKLFGLPGDGLERLFTGVFWAVVFSCIFLHAAVYMEGGFLEGLFA
ncbi:hypothetical protein PTSG_00461 [Salpingoeca rosetta]|uniref:Acyltransferase n=1 Tax=Salpingoeca rosetta (strain ATCC 50818 / BSB-021) TaxID=946362 RepID=F2TWJ5_SALR5|nr:uncharacterized protein PTSG_00461 [Salpingoeca rosetta]EGD72441.1 hypothetical protein PTSG_00461 [Salpingoeca rosetta]|eukprot:XP_004999010.1 hypothetical protein PTSG_00461 [Salpingoeca rosetta]